VRLKVAAALLLTLRGTPFMYYGEEIGQRDIRITRENSTTFLREENPPAGGAVR